MAAAPSSLLPFFFLSSFLLLWFLQEIVRLYGLSTGTNPTSSLTASFLRFSWFFQSRDTTARHVRRLYGRHPSKTLAQKLQFNQRLDLEAIGNSRKPVTFAIFSIGASILPCPWAPATPSVGPLFSVNHFDTVVTMADDTIAAIHVGTPSSALWRDNETFDMQEHTNLLPPIQKLNTLDKEHAILNQKLASQTQEVATLRDDNAITIQKLRQRQSRLRAVRELLIQLSRAQEPLPQHKPANANHVPAQPLLHPPTRQQQQSLQQQHKVPAVPLVPAIVVITTDATRGTATSAPTSTSLPPRSDSCHRGQMSMHTTTCHGDFIRATWTPFHSATHRRWDPGKDNTIIEEQQQSQQLGEQHVILIDDSSLWAAVPTSSPLSQPRRPRHQHHRQPSTRS